MKIKTILSIIILIVAISGCKDTVTEGTVVDKWYEDASTDVVMVPQVTSIGKTTVTTMVATRVYDDEDYCIKLLGITSRGDTITKRVELNEKKWNSVEVGDYIYIEKH